MITRFTKILVSMQIRSLQVVLLLSLVSATTTTASSCALTAACAGRAAGARSPGLLLPQLQLHRNAPTLKLRGGGKSKQKTAKADKETTEKTANKEKKEKKRARDEDASSDAKRAKSTSSSSKLKLMCEDSGADESEGVEDDSVDELEYTTPPEGGEFGGVLGAHALGTVPVEVSRPPPISKDAAGGHAEDSTSESYPGCYSDDSEDVEEEAEEEVERSEPLPTRDELMQRIRDRPFNQTLVRPRPNMNENIL